MHGEQSNTDGLPARPGSQMDQAMSSSTSGSNAFQSKSKTTSAPTSPLKEKKSSFFGKVSNFFHYYFKLLLKLI